MTWVAGDVLGACRRALEARAAALAEERAVHGIDALSEVALHPILADGLRAAGWGVVREACYPGDVASRPWRAERERCDLVVLPDAGSTLADPVRTLREADRVRGTLFESLCAVGVDGVPPEDAYWIEVKVVAQHAYTHGVPGPNTAYAGELTRAFTQDLAKLSREPRVARGGVLLVHFTSDDRTADHDLAVALHRAVDRGLAFRSPVTERFGVRDHAGNAVCTVALTEIVASR